jgi:hypothetical protein
MATAARKYCYLQPVFPQSPYLAVLLFGIQGGHFMPYPFNYLFNSLDAVKADLKTIIEQPLTSIKVINTSVYEDAVLYPLTFLNTYPLKPEHWAKPAIDLDTFQRMMVFVPALKDPQLYRLLALPATYRPQFGWELQAAMPFPYSDDNSAVEAFLMASTFPTEQKAKSAGLYRMAAPYNFNWRTGEVSEIEAFKASGGYELVV